MRLETLGFTDVYDFAVGRAAWAAAGLPLEGADAELLTTSDAAKKDVFTCTLGDALQGMSTAIDAAGQDDCIVLNDDGVVMGRTRKSALQAASSAASVDDVMEIGPTTVRPDERLDAVVERMRRRGVRSLVVATHQGKLIGLLERETAEEMLGIDGSEIERE